jgi:hypothetical protein
MQYCSLVLVEFTQFWHHRLKYAQIQCRDPKSAELLVYLVNNQEFYELFVIEFY